MSAGMVLSIHSVHAKKIYEGTKRYEYRTRRPKRKVDYIALYETGRTRAITGVAKITGILEDTPKMIWELTKSFSGISPEYFKNYFSGKKKAIAYCISEVIPFERPVVLGEVGIDRAPQSFQYIDESEVQRIVATEIENKKPLLPRFFVGGIHGVGKSIFVEKTAMEMGLQSYSASRVISEKARESKSKRVSCVELLSNQNLLVTGLREADWFAKGGMIDGHFVLKGENNHNAAIPLDVFSQLALDAIIVVTAEPSVVASRLEARDGIIWRESSIEEMQQDELNHAERVSKHLGIPLSVIR